MPKASKRATTSLSIRRARACAAEACAVSAPSCSPIGRCVWRRTTRPRACWRKASQEFGLDRLPWTKALRQWRDRVMFLRGAEGEEWPDLSDSALAATAKEWLAAAFAGKTTLADLGADALTETVHGLLPWTLRRRLDAEAPTHFAAPSGSSVPIDYTEEGTEACDPRAGTVRPRPPPDHRRRPRPADHRTAVAGASAGAGDARSAGLLAWQLCRGQSRDARPLSTSPLARRPSQRTRDAPRQAARQLKSTFRKSKSGFRPKMRPTKMLEPFLFPQELKLLPISSGWLRLRWPGGRPASARASVERPASSSNPAASKSASLRR